MEVTIEPLDDSRFPRETSCFQPLQPVRVVIAGARRALAAAVTVSDGAGVVYAARNVALDGGSGEFAFRVRGVLGVHTVKALPGGSVEPMAMHRFGVRAETRVCTGDATFDALVPRLKAFVLDNVGALFVGRDCVKGCRPQSGDWSVAIRDHAYQLKALRYWEADVKSAVEHFCKRQLPDGSLYEYVGRGDRRRLYERDRHSRMHYDEQHDAFYYRDALQADVEHLGVEAAYIAWQATGDDKWMRSLLPALEKALECAMSDPRRWSKEWGLVMRGAGMDAWDVRPGDVALRPRAAAPADPDDEEPAFIVHADNTGMHRGCRLLAKMFAHLRLYKKAAEWNARADHFRDRANDVCWNGRFYRHRVCIAPGRPDEEDDEERLSLGNACALNRGTLTQGMAASIIEEYQRRRELNEGTHFAEWFSMDPPFPEGSQAAGGLKPGVYVNGGIMPLVGGELALGAFRHGFERYGVDILRRYHSIVAKANATYLWYHPDGRPPRQEAASPADGWGAAAMLCAFMEGLCGVVDELSLYQRVTLSPRWAAAGIERALVCAKYGASDAYFACDYTHEGERIVLELSGSGETVVVHLLLPQGFTPVRVEANGSGIPFQVVEVGPSRYVDFTIGAGGRRVVIVGGGGVESGGAAQG